MPIKTTINLEYDTIVLKNTVSNPSLKAKTSISFKIWTNGIKKIKNKTIETKIATGSADITENAKIKIKNANNK